MGTSFLYMLYVVIGLLAAVVVVLLGAVIHYTGAVKERKRLVHLLISQPQAQFIISADILKVLLTPELLSDAVSEEKFRNAFLLYFERLITSPRTIKLIIPLLVEALLGPEVVGKAVQAAASPANPETGRADRPAVLIVSTDFANVAADEAGPGGPDGDKAAAAAQAANSQAGSLG